MSRLPRTLFWSCALIAVASQHLAGAETLSAEDRSFFEGKIRPVLVKHCFECHAADSKEVGGKLLLDSREGIITGGESGTALVAGSPDQSLLIQSLRYDDLEMPPAAPLPETVVNDFVNWVARGAVDPRADETSREETASIDPESLWSFLPRRVPELPEVTNRDWPRDPIDHFVLARIEAAKITPTHDAGSTTLVRRMFFDLVGLPPTAAQVEAFAAEHHRDRSKAVSRLVDALLDKPQFGQRWGRHWLDVARYGESNGDDGLGRNATFPHAWRYRDYVIDALNNDVPYDRFLTEQIAGDRLPAETAEQRNRQLVATGFLAIGSKPAAAMNKNFAMDVVDDQINVVCTAVTGLSVACARCHDHKHDPIPTRDYYALAGIFASTETLYGLAANEKLTAPPTALHELNPNWNENEEAIRLHGASGQPRGGRTVTLAMGVREKAKPADCKIHINGDGGKLGAEVSRGFLSAYRTIRGKKDQLAAGITIDAKQSGRLELADWLTRPEHPQTARVIVNRIWLHLFGQGIVATPDDFGVYGARPTHPELLDHLANRFVRDDWSIKRLIRSIVLSRTYQLDSHGDAATMRADPDNELLARHDRRRLDAESLRDSMLQASGNLIYSPAHGSAVEKIDALINWPPGEATNLHRHSNHRSVYLCMLRHNPPPELAAFDFPDAIGIAGQRNVTTLPTQSLYLLNGRFVVEQSEALATNVLADPDFDDSQRVRAIFRRTLLRNPNEIEARRAVEHVRAVCDSLTLMKPDPKPRQLKAWASLCQALLTTNEFRYVD